ncbi:MAG: sulfite exporter TauE/SafE family protein [Granulosicoccus sp.]
MLASLENFLALSTADIALAGAVVLLASIVRGFSGFGLSALIMAGLALVVAPAMLIPICFLLEGVASLLLIKNGFKKANHRVVWVLAIGSAIGVPIGLAATTSITPEVSRIVALSIILLLAGLQLTKATNAIFELRYGLHLTGILAGIATGLAGAGGMVIALFVLAQSIPAQQMRASMVMFLFLGLFTSGFWLYSSGLLDSLAFSRALALSPLVFLGVSAGALLFKPSLEHIYKLFCLCLLIALASFGLLRVLITA